MRMNNLAQPRILDLALGPVDEELVHVMLGNDAGDGVDKGAALGHLSLLPGVASCKISDDGAEKGSRSRQGGGTESTRHPFSQAPPYACNALRRLGGPWQDEHQFSMAG